MNQYVVTPVIPTEPMWSGLARDIIMWHDAYERRTPRTLFLHLERTGTEIPQWLRDEPEMQSLDHVPSKGTRATIIYKAMLLSAPCTSALMEITRLHQWLLDYGVLVAELSKGLHIDDPIWEQIRDCSRPIYHMAIQQGWKPGDHIAIGDECYALDGERIVCVAKSGDPK